MDKAQSRTQPPLGVLAIPAGADISLRLYGKLQFFAICLGHFLICR